MKVSPTPHLNALTGIRAIAAWVVVLYHLRPSLKAIMPGWFIADLAKGYLAVDLFFVLSGFVIAYNYAERVRDGGMVEVRLFLWRRFARVWPLHATILVGFVAFALLLELTGRNTAGYPWRELPLHFALLQNWGLTSHLSWNHPAWSISTETAAYLLFPTLVMAQRALRLPGWLQAGLIALGLHLFFAAQGEVLLGARIETLGLWRCLAQFAMGMALCSAWQQWRGIAGAAKWAALCALALLAAGLFLALPETAFVPATIWCALLALALDTGPAARAIGGRVLTYLGEISYSTYLAHFGLFIVFKLLFVDATLQIGWGGLAGFLGLTLVASVVLYHGLEKPAQRWLNRNPPPWVRAPSPAQAT